MTWRDDDGSSARAALVVVFIGPPAVLATLNYVFWGGPSDLPGILWALVAGAAFVGFTGNRPKSK
jgi:hypothetical protein